MATDFDALAAVVDRTVRACGVEGADAGAPEAFDWDAGRLAVTYGDLSVSVSAAGSMALVCGSRGGVTRSLTVPVARYVRHTAARSTLAGERPEDWQVDGVWAVRRTLALRVERLLLWRLFPPAVAVPELESLAPEALRAVAQFLDARGLLATLALCRRIRANDAGPLWAMLCARDFPRQPVPGLLSYKAAWRSELHRRRRAELYRSPGPGFLQGPLFL